MRYAVLTSAFLGIINYCSSQVVPVSYEKLPGFTLHEHTSSLNFYLCMYLWGLLDMGAIMYVYMYVCMVNLLRNTL